MVATESETALPRAGSVVPWWRTQVNTPNSGLALLLSSCSSWSKEPTPGHLSNLVGTTLPSRVATKSRRKPLVLNL